MTTNPAQLKDLKTFLSTRHKKVSDAEYNLKGAYQNRDLAKENYTELTLELQVLIAKYEASYTKHEALCLKAQVEYDHANRFWYGPEGVHWLCGKSNIKPTELMDLLVQAKVDIEADTQLHRALEIFYSNPGVADFKAAEVRYDADK